MNTFYMSFRISVSVLFIFCLTPYIEAPDVAYENSLLELFRSKKTDVQLKCTIADRVHNVMKLDLPKYDLYIYRRIYVPKRIIIIIIINGFRLLCVMISGSILGPVTLGSTIYLESSSDASLPQFLHRDILFQQHVLSSWLGISHSWNLVYLLLVSLVRLAHCSNIFSVTIWAVFQ